MQDPRAKPPGDQFCVCKQAPEKNKHQKKKKWANGHLFLKIHDNNSCVLIRMGLVRLH